MEKPYDLGDAEEVLANSQGRCPEVGSSLLAVAVRAGRLCCIMQNEGSGGTDRLDNSLSDRQQTCMG